MIDVPLGSRIKFMKQDNLLVSHKVYTDGNKYVRLVLDLTAMEYMLKDAMTGFIFERGGGVNNREVLQRKGKKALKNFLRISFEKEKRNAANG